MDKTKLKRICPNCGTKMKQQFLGLQHCKCGISWMKGKEFFTRTSDMVFVFETHIERNRLKKTPAIRYKESADTGE